MKKQAEQWLNAAADDLKVVEKILSDESLTNMVSFHSQQAIEKSLKCILEEYESKVPRIHNLIKLTELTTKYMKLDIEKILLERVNEIYTDTRYPSDLGLIPEGKPSLNMASSFFEAALRIHREVSDKLSKEMG